MVDELTAVDRVLYRAAMQRVMASIRLVEKAAGFKILCPSRMAAFSNATRYIHDEIVRTVDPRAEAAKLSTGSLDYKKA